MADLQLYVLTLEVPDWTAADNNFFQQTIRMKFQDSFSLKKTKKVCCLLQILHSTLRLKINMHNCADSRCEG